MLVFIGIYWTMCNGKLTLKASLVSENFTFKYKISGWLEMTIFMLKETSIYDPIDISVLIVC